MGNYEHKLPRKLDCGMAVMMEIIGGKWKPCLIYNITKGHRRPTELQKLNPMATRRVLNQQLKELEEHGIVYKIVYPGLPLKVEYFLTDLGESMLPVIDQMQKWGFAYMDAYNEFLDLKKGEGLPEPTTEKSPV